LRTRTIKIPTIYQKYTGYRARLLLENGKIFDGIGFGYPTRATGEVVFNTGMVGYTESLTDPSYHGQLLCMTYPLIGNYGVPSFDIKDEYGLPKYFESDKIHPRALLIHNLSEIASHWNCIKTLDQWLYEERIPGIYGIDTRELTKIIRIKGVMMGCLHVTADDEIDNLVLEKNLRSDRYEGKNFMNDVSVNKPHVFGKEEDKTIVLLDTGTKYSIIRNILKLGFRVVQLPWNTSFEDINSYSPIGVVISNGPGDPKVCNQTIDTARRLIETSTPTLGICLGNQILALAAGADTYKLKYGHRGQNKSCKEVTINQSFITSQNHGYGIEADSLKKSEFNMWFQNPDDKSVEGIIHKSKPIIAVQFHPEASPGPFDCTFVFDKFKELVLTSKTDQI